MKEEEVAKLCVTISLLRTGNRVDRESVREVGKIASKYGIKRMPGEKYDMFLSRVLEESIGKGV